MRPLATLTVNRQTRFITNLTWVKKRTQDIRRVAESKMLRPIFSEKITKKLNYKYYVAIFLVVGSLSYKRLML